jgi:hypothetical protein
MRYTVRAGLLQLPAGVNVYASSLIRAGVDVLRVSRLLVHASPDITLRLYGHRIDKGCHDAAEKLEAMMLGAGVTTA